MSVIKKTAHVAFNLSKSAMQIKFLVASALALINATLAAASVATNGETKTNADNAKTVLRAKKVESVLKAIVVNLPESCDDLKQLGQFDSRKAESYNCMFEADGEFSRKKVAVIMSLLMQAEKVKLVQSIAKSWIERAGWGPYNQEAIISDLKVVLKVQGTSVPFVSETRKSKKHQGNEENLVEIEAKAVYGAFKLLLEAGNELIVPDAAYSKAVVPRLFNLTAAVDKAEKDKLKTVELIIETFFSIESKPEKQVKRLGQAHALTKTLNKLAEEGEIKVEAWNAYGEVICKYLNEKYSTEFDMIEMENASESKVRPTKLIGIQVKASSTKKPIKSASSTRTSTPVTPVYTFSNAKMGTALVISGSVLLLAILGYAIHLIMKKQRELEEY